MFQGPILCVILGFAAVGASVRADSPATAPADTEAQYAAALAKRVDDIVVALNLNDTAKAQRVGDILHAHYRGLRARHDSRDARLAEIPKEDKDRRNALRAETDESVKALRGEFLSRLGAELTPEQIEIVKNKMTYNKVAVTYNGYLEMLPKLTAAQQETIHGYLVAAREDAIDGGSSEEKTRIFEKAKGKINNYLSKEGYDLKQASKDWTERRKAAKAGGN